MIKTGEKMKMTRCLLLWIFFPLSAFSFDVLSPEETFEASSPEEVFEVSSPEETFEASSPEEAFEVLSPEETFEVLSPEEIFEVLSPEETFEVLSPEEIFEVLSPEETFEVLSPEEAFEASHDFPSLEQDSPRPVLKLKKDLQKKQRIRIELFNDNLGSKGNDWGLTHGSRLIYSQEAFDGKSWSLTYESQLYLAPIFVIEKDKKAVVYVVERNDLKLEERIPLSRDEYVVLGVLAGYTTNNDKHFMFLGAQNQQEQFHNILNSRSSTIMEYIYDQNQCDNVKKFYDYQTAQLADTQRHLEQGCMERRPEVLDSLKRQRLGCADIPELIDTRRIRIKKDLRTAEKRCRHNKTRLHIGGKIGFGKIYRWDTGRRLCSQSQNDLSCVAHLRLEGGMDLITVKRDSKLYLLTKLNHPLVSFGKNSTLSAFIKLDFHQPFGEKLERRRSLGLHIPFKNSSVQLELTQLKHSSGRLFDISNDDDNILTMVYEYVF